MNGAVQCYLYWLAVLILVLPWCVATILTWIYTEVFAAIPSSSTGSKDNNSLGSAGGTTISIIQTASVVVYLFYIFLALTCIGFSGRRSIFSYCCLVVGIMVFTVVPLAAGGTLLVVALLSFSENRVGAGVGIAAAVFCFLSTAICLVMTCWALMCGSRGRGKNHRYPIPLAYLPFLRDFEKIRTEVEVSAVNRHTKDYPSPLHSFSDHNTDPVGRYVIPPKSKSSGKQDESGRKASVTSSGGVSEDRKLSVTSGGVSKDRKLIANESSTINAERKVFVNTQSTSDSRKFSVGSTTNSTNTADRKYSITSLPRATHKLSAENLASQSSRDRTYSVNSRIVSAGSSAGPMKALPYKYSVGSSTSQPNVAGQNMSNGVGRYVIPSGKQDESGQKASVTSKDRKSSVTSSDGVSKDRKLSVTSSGGVSKDRKLSAVSSNESFSSSTINAEREVFVNAQSTSDSRKFSVGSTTNSTNTADRKYSITSLPIATHKLSTEKLASQSSRDRTYSVNSRIVSTGSSADPMKALPYKYSVGSSTSQPNVGGQNMSNGTGF